MVFQCQLEEASVSLATFDLMPTQLVQEVTGIRL